MGFSVRHFARCRRQGLGFSEFKLLRRRRQLSLVLADVGLRGAARPGRSTARAGGAGPQGTDGDSRADDMSRAMGPAKAVNYGLDAPYVVRNFGLAGAVCLAT